METIEEHLISDRGEWYLNTKLAGGGCIMDNGPHLYDIIVQCMGHLEASSAVDIKRAPTSGIDMTATVVLISYQGLPAVVHLGFGLTGL